MQAKTLSRQNTALPNNNWLIVGASGSGKSAFMRQKLDMKAKRIIAWDPDEDYKLPRVRDMKTFEKLVKKSGFGNIRAAVTVEPTEENFEHWSALVFAIAHQAAPMEIIADEIADVTRISKASPHWGQLCRKIRKYGGKLYAITQRPQECDKTIFNQTKFKWCGALASNSAYKYMANEFDLPISELKALDNIEQKQIQFYIKEGTQAAQKHQMTFKPKKIVKIPTQKQH